jgi:hypothetical protein
MLRLTGRSIFYLHSARTLFPNCVAPSRRRPLIKEVAMRVRSSPLSDVLCWQQQPRLPYPFPKMEEARASKSMCIHRVNSRKVPQRSPRPAWPLYRSCLPPPSFVLRRRGLHEALHLPSSRRAIPLSLTA